MLPAEKYLLKNNSSVYSQPGLYIFPEVKYIYFLFRVLFDFFLHKHTDISTSSGEECLLPRLPVTI